MALCPASMLFQLTKWFVLEDHCYGQWGVVFHLPSWMESVWSPAGAQLGLLKNHGPIPHPTVVAGVGLRHSYWIEVVLMRLTFSSLIPAGLRSEARSQKLSVRERHRLCAAHLVSHTLQRCSVGIRLPDRQSRETRWGCRGSECTNSTVLFWVRMSL